LEVAQLIEAEQVDAAMAGDDFGEGSVVVGFANSLTSRDARM